MFWDLSVWSYTAEFCLRLAHFPVISCCVCNFCSAFINQCQAFFKLKSTQRLHATAKAVQSSKCFKNSHLAVYEKTMKMFRNASQVMVFGLDVEPAMKSQLCHCDKLNILCYCFTKGFAPQVFVICGMFIQCLAKSEMMILSDAYAWNVKVPYLILAEL